MTDMRTICGMNETELCTEITAVVKRHVPNIDIPSKFNCLVEAMPLIYGEGIVKGREYADAKIAELEEIIKLKTDNLLLNHATYRKTTAENVALQAKLEALDKQEPIYYQATCDPVNHDLFMADERCVIIDKSYVEDAVSDGFTVIPLYAAPKPAEVEGMLSAEDIGIIMDGLILEKDRAISRKSTNPESNSNLIAADCDRLLKIMLKAAKENNHE